MSIYSINTASAPSFTLKNNHSGIFDVVESIRTLQKDMAVLSGVLEDAKLMKEHPHLAPLYSGDDLVAAVSGVAHQSEFSVAKALIK